MSRSSLTSLKNPEELCEILSRKNYNEKFNTFLNLNTSIIGKHLSDDFKNEINKIDDNSKGFYCLKLKFKKKLCYKIGVSKTCLKERLTKYLKDGSKHWVQLINIEYVNNSSNEKIIDKETKIKQFLKKTWNMSLVENTKEYFIQNSIEDEEIFKNIIIGDFYKQIEDFLNV